jgi:hypothetical protein
MKLYRKLQFVRYGVFKAVIIKNATFWDVIM